MHPILYVGLFVTIVLLLCCWQQNNNSAGSMPSCPLQLQTDRLRTGTQTEQVPVSSRQVSILLLAQQQHRYMISTKLQSSGDCEVMCTYKCIECRYKLDKMSVCGNAATGWYIRFMKFSFAVDRPESRQSKRAARSSGPSVHLHHPRLTSCRRRSTQRSSSRVVIAGG